MSGKISVDTNILIYLLKGNKDVVSSLENKDVYISVVTELELLSYKKITIEEEQLIRELMTQLKVIELNNSIKEETIRLRKKYPLKLPDAIVLATANFLNIPLVSADKIFEKATEDAEVILVELNKK